MYSELIEGIDVLDENGEVVGQSKAAARSAITQVTLSRIIMATPGMGNGSFFILFFVISIVSLVLVIVCFRENELLL